MTPGSLPVTLGSCANDARVHDGWAHVPYAACAVLRAAFARAAAL